MRLGAATCSRRKTTSIHMTGTNYLILSASHPPSCEPKEEDLQWVQRASMPGIVAVQMQQLAQGEAQPDVCHVRVAVLESTSTGGHRVKLEGVMVQVSQGR